MDEPHWGYDPRGRFHYTDYDGESLVVRRNPDGSVWVDKRGEGPVYITKEHVALIAAAMEGKTE